MAQAGGSATAYGILYQILGSLDWMVGLRIQDAVIEDGKLLQARLVIEPAGGGGDLRIELPGGRRIIEQWKSRRTSKQWTLKELVADVLPDLYLAVPWPEPQEDEVYRFVTEGKRNASCEKALGFFQELRSISAPEEPLDSLDRRKALVNIGKKRYTRRTLFEAIVRAVRERKAIREGEEEVLTRQKLLYLLGRFEMQDEVSGASLRSSLDKALRPLVDSRDNIASKREQLCGLILEMAGEGDVSLTLKELLQRAELDVLSLNDHKGIQRALRPLLDREIRNSGYEPEKDVRRAPSWPEGSTVLAFSGESGQGKTWQLARLARELSAAGGLVVWLSAQRSVRDDLQEGADRLWKEGCRHETSLGLGELARRWSTVNPDVSRPWLTVCIDDVQDFEEASRLVASPWEQWEVRLAMTVPPAVGHRLQENGVAVLPVPLFLLSELRAYLARRGRALASVPADVIETLKLPLLARIYCDLSAEPDWVPANEYHLYKGYWTRIERDRQQIDFPQDMERVRRLALNLLAPEKSYPWTGNELMQADVDDAAQRRLESIGWLRRQDPGTVLIVHDRLLSWAVAEAVAEQHRRGQMGTGELVATLAACTNFDSGFKRWLGYVPMDVLWLLSGSVSISASTIAEILLAMELSSGSFYEGGLPTLGARIVPGLVERVRRIDSQDSNAGFLPKWIVESLIRSIEGSHLPAYEDSVRWLSDSNPFVQEVAARVLARFPLPAALDPLWRLHESRTRIYRGNDDLDTYSAYFASFKALSACVRLSPSWLDSQIRLACIATESEMLGELARLLASVESPSGPEIWARWKSCLFAKVPSDDREYLIYCVGAFGDLEEVSRLEEWAREVSDDPRNAVRILRELVWLAPDRAIALIPDLPRVVFAFGNEWLPALLLWRPVEGCKVVRDLLERGCEDFWPIALAFQHCQDSLDPATLRVILDRLAIDTRELRATGGEIPPGTLQKRWVVIAGIHRLDLLREIEARAETSFEEDLSFLARCWIGRRKESRDYELEEVTAILLQIGGRGWGELIEAGIRSAPHYRRIKSLVLARCLGSESILAVLREIAHLEPGDEKREIERRYAVGALAALGDDGSVIEAILHLGSHAAPGNVLYLRKGLPPMSDALLKRGTTSARDADSEIRVRGLRALALTGRDEILDLIPEMLGRVADTKEKDAVLDLIRALAHSGSEATRRLAGRLDLSSQTQAAEIVLLRLATEESFDRLEDFLRSAVQEGRRLNMSEMELAVRLACSSEGRTIAAEVAWRDLQGTHPLQQSPWHFKAVAQLDNPEIQERLLAEAIQASDHNFARPDIAVTAIFGLAGHSPDDAFRAAERALLVFDPYKSDIPELLIQLDPDKAISCLLEQAFREEKIWRFWQTGRALRRVSGNDGLRARLSAALCSPQSGQRAKAVQLCGWIGAETMPEDLRRLALEDSASEVRRSYLEASRRQRNQAHVRELLAAFATAEGLKRWSYLHAVLEVGDPVLLGRRGDQLCVWPFLDDAGGAYRLAAEKRIEERTKESEEAAKQIDRNRDWI